MIKFKAAYTSETGKPLDAQTALCGGVTPQAVVDALGDIMARLAHHAVAACGDKVDPLALLVDAVTRATDVYSALPEITDDMREVARDCNEAPDSEPEFCREPSGDDHQVVTCGMSLRVNGFEVYQGGAASIPIPFDELPTAAASLVGTVAAHCLTGSVTPANIMARGAVELETFKAAWDAHIPLGMSQREAAAVAVNQRRMHKFITGELDEGN